MWRQHYTPLADSVGWSAAVASAPILILFYLLAIRRKPAWVSALAGLGAAILLALLLYGMPPPAALSAALFGAAFGLMPIGWITLTAVFLYRLTQETGQFDVIRSSLAHLTGDRRLQALLIAFAFGAFIEGAAGSGVPVAVGAAMLSGLGFQPLHAAGICLLANTSPVPFGAIGSPVLTLAATTGLPVHPLSAAVGRICAPLSLCVPVYMTVLMAGWKGLRGALPAALVCGVSFGGMQWLVSNLVGPQATDIVASICSMVCLVLLFRVWQPSDGPTSAGASALPRYGSAAIFRGWLPYGLLAAFVLLWSARPVAALLAATNLVVPWPALHHAVLRMPPLAPVPAPYAARYTLDWLACAGTACLAAAVLSAAFARVPPRTFLRVFAVSLRQMIFPLITICAVVGLAFVMNYSGATVTLGLAFAATGPLFPFFSSLLGWVGVFLTGSDTSANALFGNLQVVTAHRLGLNPILMAASNSSGGVMGKMISIQSIAVAVAATGMKTSEEAALFRFTFRHSLLLASGIGLLTMFYAYVTPQWMPR